MRARLSAPKHRKSSEIRPRFAAHQTRGCGEICGAHQRGHREREGRPLRSARCYGALGQYNRFAPKGRRGQSPSALFAVVRNIAELKRLQEKESDAAAEKGRTEAVEKYGKELEAKVKELEKFHKVAVGRELKMKRMEEELERLRAKLGEK